MTPGVFLETAAHVRVPATSANLGSGFDSLGLALTLHDEVIAAVGSEGLTIEVQGEGGAVPRDEAHLVVRSMRAAFDRLGGQPPGLVLRCVNRIPHGRGLGSSAAAIVGGVLLARALVRDGADRLDDTAAFDLCAQIEGHPDNVAACLFGGLTIAWNDPVTGARAVRAAVARRVRPVLLVPLTESSTAAARRLLPATVPHADAAFAAGRSALLTALLTGAAEPSPGALLAATDDRLHQPYRAAGAPATAGLVADLRAAGLAAMVSGAGPAVLVLLPGTSGAGTTDAGSRAEIDVEAIRSLLPSGWRLQELEVDTEGASLVS